MRLATVLFAAALAASPAAIPQPPKPVSENLGPPRTTSAAPPSTPEPSGPDPALIPLPIPDTVPETLAQLRTRIDQIRGLIDSGSFASVYVPAFQAKDLALALDTHVKELPSDRQVSTSTEIANLVRVAYMLDAFGDIGNRQQITEAFIRFAAAAKGIDAGFSAKP